MGGELQSVDKDAGNRHRVRQCLFGNFDQLQMACVQVTHGGNEGALLGWF